MNTRIASLRSRTSEPGSVSNRFSRPDVDVERDRAVSVVFYLNTMRTHFQVQMLEDAVEVVDEADVVAVGEHARVARRVGDPQTAIQPSRNRIVVAARRVPVRVVAVRTVNHAGAIARTIDVRTIR